MAKQQVPQTVDDVLEAIKHGRLDRRRRQARAVEEVKTALEVAPQETAKAMLRHTIALNTLVERELIDFVVAKQGELLDPAGRLPEALSKDLLAMQRATLTALRQLIALETSLDGSGAKNGPKDVSDIILEQDNPKESDYDD